MRSEVRFLIGTKTIFPIFVRKASNVTSTKSSLLKLTLSNVVLKQENGQNRKLPRLKFCPKNFLCKKRKKVIKIKQTLR